MVKRKRKPLRNRDVNQEIKDSNISLYFFKRLHMFRPKQMCLPNIHQFRRYESTQTHSGIENDTIKVIGGSGIHSSRGHKHTDSLYRNTHTNIGNLMCVQIRNETRQHCKWKLNRDVSTPPPMRTDMLTLE